eukprot:NODE_58_length_28395_cov_1.465720.p32 type:complete len:100 gc:universal NODE_58_length_28395_cov_1.465720:22669-22968(+)
MINTSWNNYKISLFNHNSNPFITTFNVAYIEISFSFNDKSDFSIFVQVFFKKLVHHFFRGLISQMDDIVGRVDVKIFINHLIHHIRRHLKFFALYTKCS